MFNSNKNSINVNVGPVQSSLPATDLALSNNYSLCAKFYIAPNTVNPIF